MRIRLSGIAMLKIVECDWARYNCSQKGVEAPVKTAVDKFQLLPAFLKVPTATLHKNCCLRRFLCFEILRLIGGFLCN